MGFNPQGTAQGLDSTAPGNRPGTPATKRNWAAKSLVLLAVLLASTVACSQGELSTWNPAGPVAEKQLLLFNVLVWIMVVVFILVEGVLLYAILRYRRRPGQPRPSQVHGHLALEIAWTIIPTILIMALGVWSVITVFEIEKPPASADYVLEVTVTGHQWWWEFEYPDAGGGKSITTANELRIPVDTPVLLSLESDDVIHSFWVPRLAGKVDVIPTHTNIMWIQADSDKLDTLPATIQGVCAEFCGTSHALMKFSVRVLEQADYDAWVEGYGDPPTLSAKAQEGQRVFAINCSFCHTATGPDTAAIIDGRVAGFLAGGNIAPAPNLTDLATRKTIASGLLDLNEENLATWLQNPAALKPGNYMTRRAPLYQSGKLSLSTDEVSSVIEYLLSLK